MTAVRCFMAICLSNQVGLKCRILSMGRTIENQVSGAPPNERNLFNTISTCEGDA